jgi:hypothetical protein
MTRPRSALDDFFHPGSASPVLDVLRASARLRDPDAQGPARSHGCVKSSETLRRKGKRTIAHRSGLWSKVIFGRGDERFGHLLLPLGVVHPALAATIGELVGLTAVGVHAVALRSAGVDGAALVAVDTEDGEEWLAEHPEQSGLDYLRSRLAEVPPSPLRAELEAAGFSPSDLLVEAIPVLPPGDRPLCAHDDPTILGSQLGRVNEAYVSLLDQADRARRLLELSAPAIITAADLALMQAAFDRLHGALTGAPAPALERRWPSDTDLDDGPPSSEPLRGSFLASPPASSGISDEGSATQPIASLWLDDERLLVQLPHAVFVIEGRDGRVLAEHAILGLTARFTDEAGQRVVFLGRSSLDDGSGPQAVAVLSMDTPEGRWLDAYPRDLPSVTADDTPDDDEEGDPEFLDLVDFRSGNTVSIEVAAESPARLFAISRGDRFVWLGGRGEAGGVIVNTETLVTHAALDAMSFDPERGPYLTATGDLADEAPSSAEDAEDEQDPQGDESLRAPAFVLSSERRFRFLTPDGVVAENTEQLFTIAFPRAAAAWSPRGDRLLVLDREEGLIIEVGRQPRIERRIDLRPLALRLRGMES